MTTPERRPSSARRATGTARWAGAATVLLALFLLSGLVRANPPAPLTPFMLPGDADPAPAVGDQTEPVIARGGAGFLAVWTDERTAYLAADGQAGSQRDIYAARLDAAGDPIDTTPIVVTQRRGDQFAPRVIWNGSNWLVIWTDTVPYGPLYRFIIQGARVSPAGEVLDPEPILIRDGGTTGGTSGDHYFAGASNGSDYVLLFQDEYVQGLGTKFRIEARRFSANATLSGSAMLFSPACCYFFHQGGLAYTDGVFMAVFEGYVDSWNYGIFGLRFTSSLQNLDSYPLEVVTIPMQGETHFYRTPNVAAGNGMFYVGWQLYITETSSQIHGARVDTDGTSLDGDGVPVSGTLPLTLDLSPQVAWDGTQWILGWDQGDLALARVDAGGLVLDPGGVDTGLVPGSFAPAGDGGLQLVRSMDLGQGFTPADVVRTPVAADLGVGADQVIGLGAPAQVGVALASGPDGSLVVYRRDTSGETRIMAHPIGAGGDALTTEPVTLAAGQVDEVRVAFDGTRYLAVWSDGASGQVHGRRLDQDGNLLDAAELVLLDGDRPDVAGRAGEFYVSASRSEGIGAVRVAGGDGSVIDDPVLALGSGPHAGPVSAALGEYFLTVWQANGVGDGSEIALSLVDAAGNVIGPLDVTQPGDGLAPRRPAVSSGETALIVWEDDRGEDVDLYGRRLASSISFLDPAAGFVVADAPGDQSAPAVASDGVRFLDVYTDARDPVDELDLRTDVYRGWVSLAGLVDEPGGLEFLADAVPEIDPAVAGHAGSALYAASRFTAAAPHGAYRIWLSSAGLPTAAPELPAATRVLALYPNPANPAVSIRFHLARAGEARVDIHDLTGARVRTLAGGQLAAGDHVLRWDGRDASGRAVASGTYLFRFRGPGAEQSGKVTLLK